MKRRNIWALLPVLVLMCLFDQSQSQTPGTTVLNLRTHGWQPPDPRELDRPLIAIDHESRILVGFTVRERSGLVTRSQPSLAFRIMRFSPDGKVDLTLSLPTNAGGRNGIYLFDTDQILARANDSLQFLQTDKGNQQEGKWKILTPCALGCRVEQSDTRRTLLLYTDDSDQPLTIIRLSQQPVLKRCGKAPRFIESDEDKIQNYPQSITDEFAYFYWHPPGSENFTYRWPLCDYEHRIELPVHIWGSWKVLNDEFFVGNGPAGHRKGRLMPPGSGELTVTSFNGNVMFRQRMAKHESWDNFWVPFEVAN